MSVSLQAQCFAIAMRNAYGPLRDREGSSHSVPQVWRPVCGRGHWNPPVPAAQQEDGDA